jgi:hypothetical protein
LLSSVARRISAISIAERVSQEQCLLSQSQQENTPGVGSLVGYQVRLETASSRDTQLLFLTPGVLLRKLQSSPMLMEYTHIIIDEVHERDKYTDFLLIRLRDLLPLRPDLRLVLMSATLQTDVLMNYFLDSSDPFYQANRPVMLSIEGRMFPVQEFFLEHVLELTNFIDLDFIDEVGDIQAASMSREQLDAALAKLMSNGVSQESIAGSEKSQSRKHDSGVTVKCALCGKIFDDPVRLGEHIAVCTGIDGDDGGDVILDGQEKGADEDVSAIPSMDKFLDGTECDNDIPNNGDFDDYEDYDIEGAQELVDYQFQDSLDYPSAEEASEITVGNKWEGEGVFPTNVVQEAELTAKQKKYLDHYQTMHDDEQVDTTLLMELLHYIIKSSYGEGAILIFFPGWQEISEFNMLLDNTPPFSNRSKFLVLPLHSGIPSADQRRVLRRPPQGIRKIVLSTNIAETSLTIDDVAFVVDTGRKFEDLC